MSADSRLKATKTIGQGKAFYIGRELQRLCLHCWGIIQKKHGHISFLQNKNKSANDMQNGSWRSGEHCKPPSGGQGGMPPKSFDTFRLEHSKKVIIKLKMGQKYLTLFCSTYS